jgi:hypothetical protein
MECAITKEIIMKVMLTKIPRACCSILTYLIQILICLFIMNIFVNARQNVITPSSEILLHDALKPGNYEIDIPFDSLDGSLTIKGVVNESGSFTLNELIPQQTITYNPGNENIVQFFSGNDENPLRFLISEVNTSATLSVKLLALDTKSLIKQVTFTDEQAIYAIHNNIDPNDAVPDKELSKWRTDIQIDSSDIQNGNLKCEIIFHRNAPFADTVFLPFKQIFLDFEPVEDAYISVKIKPERNIKYARYNSYYTNDFWIENDTIGSHLEFNFVINDNHNPFYDRMLWSFVEIREEKVYPLKLFYVLPVPYLYYEYDKYRTQMPGTNKKVPDSTFFKSDLGQIRLTSKQGDTLQIRTYSNPKGEFLIRNSTGFVNELEYITFYVYEENDTFKIQDKFYKYRYFLNGTKRESHLLDSMTVYKDYHGFDFYINSNDSLTIIPSDGIYMSKLNFWSTNSYNTAEPWHFIDSIPPKIVWTNPSDNDSNVSVTTDIKIKFDEEVIGDLINRSNFILRINSPLDTITPESGSYFYEDSTAIFKPDRTLYFETEYLVMLKNITDPSGNKVNDFEFIFKTEPDTTISVENNFKSKIPLVVYPNPADDEIYISLLNNNINNISLKIYDLYGNSHNTEFKKIIDSDKIYLVININDYPAGFYLVREECSGLSYKFIKR